MTMLELKKKLKILFYSPYFFDKQKQISSNVSYLYKLHIYWKTTKMMIELLFVNIIIFNNNNKKCMQNFKFWWWFQFFLLIRQNENFPFFILISLLSFFFFSFLCFFFQKKSCFLFISGGLVKKNKNKNFHLPDICMIFISLIYWWWLHIHSDFDNHLLLSIYCLKIYFFW